MKVSNLLKISLFTVCFLIYLKGSCQSLSLEKDLMIGGSKNDEIINTIPIKKTNHFISIGKVLSSDGDLETIIPNSITKPIVVIFKSNDNLDIVWKRVYNAYNFSSNIYQINNDQAIFLGFNTDRNLKVDVVKINIHNGDIISINSIDLNEESYVYQVTNPNIILTPSNDILLTLKFEKNGSIQPLLKIAKISSNNNILWTRTIENINSTDSPKLFINNNILSLFTGINLAQGELTTPKLSYNEVAAKITQINLDILNGKTLKQKYIGGDGVNMLVDIIQNGSNFYLLSLHSTSKNTNKGDFPYLNAYNCNVISKLDIDGNVIWHKPESANAYARLLIDEKNDLIISSQGFFSKYSTNGSLIWRDNLISALLPPYGKHVEIIQSTPDYYFCSQTKNVYSGIHKGTDIYLTKIRKNKNPIEINNISKDWLCAGESFTVSIDTSISFAPSNNFIYTLVNTSNSHSIVIGNSSKLTNSFVAPKHLLSKGTSYDYTLKIESSNPIHTTQINGIKIQTPPEIEKFDYSFEHNSNTRGNMPKLNLNVYGYSWSNAPHIFYVNNEKIGYVGDSYLSAYLPIFSDSVSFYVEKYQNLCGVYPINKTFKYNLIDDLPKLNDQKIFGGSKEDQQLDIINDSESNIYLTGISNSNNYDFYNTGQNNKSFIIKLNQSGEKEWIKTIGNAGLQKIFKLAESPDKSIVFCGVSDSNSFLGKNYDFYQTGLLGKISKSGELVWIQKFGSLKSNGQFSVEVIEDLKIDSEGNIYMCGHFDDLFGVRKTDKNGNLIWEKKIGEKAKGYKIAKSLDIDSKGNIYVGGYSKQFLDNYRGGEYDILLLKLSPNGTILNQSHIGGSYDDIINSLVILNDNIYMLGSTYSNDFEMTSPQSNDNASLFILKLSLELNKSWIRKFSSLGYPFPYNITKGKDNNLIATGLLGSSWQFDADSSYTSPNGGIWIYNISENGSKIWQKQIGSGISGWGSKCIQYSDSTFIVTSTLNYSNPTSFGTPKFNNEVNLYYGSSDIWFGVLGKPLKCVTNYNQQFPLTSNYLIKAENKIKLNNYFGAGYYYKTQASESIELLPGTEIPLGATFSTQIERCKN